VPGIALRRVYRKERTPLLEGLKKSKGPQKKPKEKKGDEARVGSPRWGERLISTSEIVEARPNKRGKRNNKRALFGIDHGRKSKTIIRVSGQP